MSKFYDRGVGFGDIVVFTVKLTVMFLSAVFLALEVSRVGDAVSLTLTTFFNTSAYYSNNFENLFISERLKILKWFF